MSCFSTGKPKQWPTMDDLDDYFRVEIRRMRAFASGRLPRAVRGQMDTEDVVQETLLRLLRVIDEIERSANGSLSAYARKALVNRFRDLYRKAGRSPDVAPYESRDSPPAASPLQTAMERETLGRYDAALQRLQPRDRAAIVARVELGLTFGEVAELLELPGEDAARMRVNRALAKVKEWMQ